MLKSLKNKGVAVVALISLMALQGCAIPGFGMTKSVSSNNAAADGGNHILGYRPVLEYPAVAEDPEIPNGAIIDISPALIRAQAAMRPAEVPSEIRALMGISPTYTIGPGDVVGVIVYDHPELLPSSGAVISQASDPTGVSVAPGFIVGATGLISFPYIGRIKLQGLTEIEASDLIATRISPYIRDPQVTVRIQSFRSRRAFVEGEVRSPGIQIFTDVPMTLAETISRAGGITATGDRSSVTLTREGKTISLDLQFLQELGVDGSNLPLQNGDIINVRNREERKVYVMGEVLRPSALLMRNGRLSLNEAIGESGGPNLSTANPGQIYVLRNKGASGTEIFHLNAENPAALALADRFSLKPRDVVYIDPVPLVQWNRLISLILPSANVINIGSEAATR